MDSNMPQSDASPSMRGGMYPQLGNCVQQRDTEVRLPTRFQPMKTVLVLALLAGAAARAQQPQTPKREENIIVTQPNPGEENDQVKARGALNGMYSALGGARWLNRGDYVLKGHTSSFYKNAPTGVGDFLQFHHALPNNQWEDRIELTKKRDVVQIWTTTEGVEVTYKGRKPLPKEQQEEYFRRIKYSLDTIANVWLKDPATLLIYGGTAVVARRQVEEVTLIDKDNNSVEVDIELSTHLPLRRIFKFRNTTYK